MLLFRRPKADRNRNGLRAALFAGTILASPELATAQATNRDTTDDAESFRNELIYGTPNRVTPVPDVNDVATAPAAERALPAPRWTFNVLAPLYFNSNAESARSGGTATGEGSPQVRLSFASPLPDLPLRITGGLDAETDRYVSSNGAGFDKLRPRLQVQYQNAEDDQAYRPFLGFIPRLDFTPTFATNFATRYDLNAGISKAFNFDAALHRLPASGTSSALADWSLGFTAIIQRRFRSPAPQSYAVLFLPSATHVFSAQWNASLGIDFTRRWFDQLAGVSQRNFTVEPVGVLEYVAPASWFGGDDRQRGFGSPAVDLVVGYERTWSNVAAANFSQWVAGFAVKAGWRF